MLEAVFSIVLKMSVSASAIAIAVLLIKHLLQKAGFSRCIMMILWLLIAFKLVCPISPQSNFSVFNLFSDYGNTKVNSAFYKNDFDITRESLQEEEKLEAEIYKTSKSKDRINFIPYIYLLGFALVFSYLPISWIMLNRMLRFAIKKDNGICVSEEIRGSFVFGIIKPRIYIPSAAKEETLENMIAHEKMHIKRLDHITKIAAWIILSFHWFNPFVWYMYSLFSVDVELACDEAVVKSLENKRLYMKSLLEISVQKEKQKFSPIVCSFENSVKKRVKNLAEFKKATIFSKFVSLLACVILCITLGTEGIEAKNEVLNSKSHSSYKVLKLPNLHPLSVPDEKKEDEENTSLTTPEDISPKEFRYKTNSVSEDLYMGFETLEYDDISVKDIEANLEKEGYFKTNDSADLKESYIKGSFTSGESIYHSKLKCDKNGNISLYLKLNTESHISAIICDSSTGIIKDGGSFVANGKNVCSFIGFEPDKTYDIVIKSSVGSEWKIQGEYIIY